MCRNLKLWPTGKVIRKTCPFREIPVRRKGRGQTGREYYGKLLENVGRKLYSLHQVFFLPHNALLFMIAKFRAGERDNGVDWKTKGKSNNDLQCAGELHSCLHHSSDSPCSLGGGVWPYARVYFDYTIATDKSARYSLQNRACRSGLKISSRTIHLVPGVMYNIVVGNSWTDFK